MAARADGEVRNSLAELVKELQVQVKRNQARSRLYRTNGVSQRFGSVVRMVRTGAYLDRDRRLFARALLVDLLYTAFPRMFADSQHTSDQTFPDEQVPSEMGLV